MDTQEINNSEDEDGDQGHSHSEYNINSASNYLADTCWLNQSFLPS